MPIIIKHFYRKRKPYLDFLFLFNKSFKFISLEQNYIKMEIGQAKGLAVNLQYENRINDARFADHQMKVAQAENQAELKMFEDDNAYMNAANSFDHNLIKQEADKTIREIGAIVRNNPDWRINPDIRRQINEKRTYLKSNKHVIRGVASDDAFKKLNEDLVSVAKNPAMHDTEAYQDLLRQKQNYLKYGNQFGEDALKTQGAQAFTYTKPADFVNISEEGLGVGNKIKSRKYKDYGNGGYEELVDDNALTASAADLYNRRKRQIQVTYNPKTDEEGIAYAKELIRPGIDLKRKLAEPHYNDALAVAKYKAAQESAATGKQLDAYEFDVRKSKGSKLEPEAVTEMLGSSPDAKIYNKDGSYVINSQGKKFIPNGIFQQANTIHPDNNGRFKVSSPKTIGVAHGFVEYSEDEIDESGLLDDHKTSDGVIKKTRENKRGKEENYYLVPAQVEFDPTNEGYRFKYNKYHGMTNKQLSSLSPLDNNASNKEVEIDSDGNIWDSETKEYLGKQ